MRSKLVLSGLTAYAVIAAIPIAFTQNNSNAGRSLPEICKSGGIEKMAAMGQDGMGMGKMDEAHQDLVKSMPEMHKNMHQGMMAKNIDVAFVCGMIAHHQGAIHMAKAELAHGNDAWAKELAQKVVDAQAAEIAEMLAWLKKKPR